MQRAAADDAPAGVYSVLSEKGAAAAVFLVYSLNENEWIPSVVGHLGVFIEEAKSACHAELWAADIAISKAVKIGQHGISFQMQSKSKRLHFY